MSVTPLSNSVKNVIQTELWMSFYLDKYLNKSKNVVPGCVFFFTYGIFLASKTNIVRCAYGQCLMFRNVNLSLLKTGHSEPALKCLAHFAIL